MIFLQLISGQRLCSWKKKCTHTSINIHTYGIPHDCEFIQASVSQLKELTVHVCIPFLHIYTAQQCALATLGERKAPSKEDTLHARAGTNNSIIYL